MNLHDGFFKKNCNTKFHEILSSDNQVVPLKQTDSQAGRHTDMTKLTVTSYNFVDMPTNS
jgi:hypothetical protein